MWGIILSRGCQGLPPPRPGHGSQGGGGGLLCHPPPSCSAIFFLPSAAAAAAAATPVDTATIAAPYAPARTPTPGPAPHLYLCLPVPLPVPLYPCPDPYPLPVPHFAAAPQVFSTEVLMHGSTMAIGTWLCTSFGMPRLTVGQQDYEITDWGTGVDRATLIIHDYTESTSAIGTVFNLPSAIHSPAVKVVSVTRWDANGNKISGFEPARGVPPREPWLCQPKGRSRRMGEGRHVLELPYTIGGGGVPPPPIVGKNEFYKRGNLVGPFLVHKSPRREGVRSTAGASVVYHPFFGLFA